MFNAWHGKMVALYIICSCFNYVCAYVESITAMGSAAKEIISLTAAQRKINMKICFTVDWEDWYHGLYMQTDEWKKLERRIQIGHYMLLEMLAKHNVKATYFLLGMAVEEFPELVQEIKDAGHELACH